MTKPISKSELRDELKEIIWSIDAKFDDNRPTMDADYYAGRILHQVDSSLESLTSKITRFEVIDHTKSLDDGGGRTVFFDYTDPAPKIEFSYQDDNRTLKVFLSYKE